MNANIQLQLSAGVPPAAFDAFHKTVYPARVLPVLVARQHASVVAEDAKFFKTMVYGTEKLIFLATVVSACLGAFLLVVGLSLVLYQAFTGGDAAAAAASAATGLQRGASMGGSRALGRGSSMASSKSKELGSQGSMAAPDAGGRVIGRDEKSPSHVEMASMVRFGGSGVFVTMCVSYDAA